ncbi:hypothetical protein [Novipirellula rosea]|uniref:Uncharacterized protein n=1 Tax=Novipirellula rosea TaxID=1031540 RepID=A0ABP8MTR1_9BACT
MAPDINKLDQNLMEAILALDVEGVKSAIKSGANVVHTRKREDMPVGPVVTPVILSHRMKDVVDNPGVTVIRKFPPKVLAHLKSTVKQHKDEIGAEEVRDRIEQICKVIAKQLGSPFT